MAIGGLGIVAAVLVRRPDRARESAAPRLLVVFSVATLAMVGAIG